MIWAFDGIENKQDVSRSKSCMKKFFKSLKKHAAELINFVKKKIKLLTDEQEKSYERLKISYICEKEFEKDDTKDGKNFKVINHCSYIDECRIAAHSICNSKYNTHK